MSADNHGGEKAGNDTTWLEIVGPHRGFPLRAGAAGTPRSNAALPTAPLRAALQDLCATFGAAYARGAEFLSRLDGLEKAMTSARVEDFEKAKAGLGRWQDRPH